MSGEALTPLRVALVSETWFPQVNGVSRTLEKLVEHLAGRGDAVLLLTPRYRVAQAPIRVETATFSSFPLPFYPEVRVVLARPAAVARELSRFRPEVVHIATEGPLGWAALRAARRLGLPAVSSFHTNFPHYLRLYGAGCLEGAAWRYLRRFHNATSVTFCPTPSIRERLLDQGFEEVAIWSRGVDGERFHPRRRDEALRRELGVSEGAVVLAYCGRLATEKNLETLLTAFGRLRPYPPVRLLLIGDGPLRPKLEAADDPRIILAGYRHGEELARFYASADLFVFPSLSDTFGNVLLEAMASGLPAVAFDVPGPGDVIRHGETGWLVGEVGVDPLVSALDLLVADPGRLGAMAEKARRYAAAQDWETINDVVRRCYLRVAGAAETPAPLQEAAAGKGVRS